METRGHIHQAAAGDLNGPFPVLRGLKLPPEGLQSHCLDLKSKEPAEPAMRQHQSNEATNIEIQPAASDPLQMKRLKTNTRPHVLAEYGSSWLELHGFIGSG